MTTTTADRPLTVSDDPAASPHDPSPQDEGRRSLARMRAINLVAVLGPPAGLVTAIALLWGVAFDWVHLAILGGMYVATGVGITVGYHRLFTHRSFRTSRPVAAILAALGSMAVEGPVLHWVAVHRRHHQHSDGRDDPHSPHGHGAGAMSVVRGMWHAHVGWMFRRDAAGLAGYVRDLGKDPMIRWMSHLFPLWVLASLLIPAALGGLITGTWTGALLGFLWGGLARLFLVHHVTWSINSVCHIWGTRPFECHDESRNNAIFGVLGFGEGWHNNHHAFPTSARHGLRWWQIDVSYLIIRGLALVRLASDVRVPTPERMMAKRAAG
jgi:stearoyl-CoA desaturase (delta-9 desaturase)